MSKFKISFAADGVGKSITITAESWGDAVEQFDIWVDGQDADIEMLNVLETEA